METNKGFGSIERMRKRANRGGKTPHSKQTQTWDKSAPDNLAFCCDGYLVKLGSLNYSQETVRERSDLITIFLNWCAERDLTQASQITRPILESYQQWLWRYVRPNGKKLGWSTQRNRISILKDWFRWMTKQNILLHNPASELDLPRKEKRLPQEALTLTQVEALMGVPNLTDPLGIRDRAMLELFYSCGLRRAELCKLELPDFNEERRTVFIRQGKGKKDRMVPIGERATQWLEKYLAEVRPRLCLDTRVQSIFLTGYGGPFNADVLSRMVSAMMEKCSLSGKGSCHLLRHTCATHMLEGGADIRYIQQLLGHANLDTTAIYTEVSIRQLQEVHARCHPTGRLA